MSIQETRELPQNIQDLIVEYIQDPDEMILLHHGRPMINRSSNKIKEIGGIIMMKHVYGLHTSLVTEPANKQLYSSGKQYYMEKNHYLMEYHGN
jgi:hypothetical protein